MTIEVEGFADKCCVSDVSLGCALEGNDVDWGIVGAQSAWMEVTRLDGSSWEKKMICGVLASA